MFAVNNQEGISFNLARDLIKNNEVTNYGNWIDKKSHHITNEDH